MNNYGFSPPVIFVTLVLGFVLGVVSVLFITRRDFVTIPTFPISSSTKLQNLKNDPIWSETLNGGKQFAEQIHPGSPYPDPSEPNVWRYFVSTKTTNVVRTFYHPTILEAGWQDTGRKPHSDTQTCALPITKAKAVCGAIYQKGEKELWLQILSTEHTQNAGGTTVPTGYETVIFLSITYRK